MSNKARSRFTRSIRRAYSRLDYENFDIVGSALSFDGVFEQVETETQSTSDGSRTFEEGEISFLVLDFAPSQLPHDTELYRSQEDTYWRVIGAPSDDGIAGEAIIRVMRTRRNRSGAL